MPSIAGHTGITGYKVNRANLQATRDRITLTLVEKKLREHTRGEIELAPTQVMAARILYDKLRPNLSAVEVTHINDSDRQSESDILARLQALVDAHPDLIRSMLDAKRPVVIDGSTVGNAALLGSETELLPSE